MKYNVGDQVKIKSRKEIENLIEITDSMLEKCGTVMTIKSCLHGCNSYLLSEDSKRFLWSDEMIEGLVETPKFKKGDCVKCSDGSCGIIVTCDWSDSLNCYQYYIDYIGTLDAGYQSEKDLQPHSITTMNGRDIFEDAKWKHEFECPDGYIFKDENGNVINATKIVLEKKKKEYPKTYEECCEVLGYSGNYNMILTTDVDNKLFNALYKLKVCRDAYWKIAGEEMGLGKPWEPDWSDYENIKYIIGGYDGEIGYDQNHHIHKILAFPTKEMRDAFYENFKELIEQCKELL